MVESPHIESSGFEPRLGRSVTIDQAAGLVASSQQAMQARQFLAFLSGRDGKNILSVSGYLVP